MREQEACLSLFMDWLAQGQDARFAIEGSEDLSSGGGLAVAASNGGRKLAAEVRPLLPPTENDAWSAQREELERELSETLDSAYAVWLPPGADLPSAPEERTEFVRHVQEAARDLEPGERSHVALPVSLYLRKVNDEGGLMSVSGGLNHLWARLTEGVRGTYDLDSTRLYRLPESEEHWDQLREEIWERGREIDQPGQWVKIDTIDAWTINRLSEGRGFAIIGRPPEELSDVALSVRRNLRRLLADATPRLRGQQADMRALVVVGLYTRMEDEGASTAMRGYDPSLYSGLEFVCLAADGRIKAMLEARSGARP